MKKTVKNIIFSTVALVALTSTSTACSVCDAIKKVESTYKIYKVQKETYGISSDLTDKHTSVKIEKAKDLLAATIQDIKDAMGRGVKTIGGMAYSPVVPKKTKIAITITVNGEEVDLEEFRKA